MQIPLFQAGDYLTPKWYFFKNSKLGQLHESLPLKELGACLPEKAVQNAGASSWFDNEGMIALMFLKHYLDISDEKLIERFNTDWSLQLFCGRFLDDGKYIGDTGIVSRIRKYIGDHIDIEKWQQTLLKHWKQDMSQTHILLMDATCYESYIRQPTDVKLLWEACQWIFENQIFKLCSILKIKRPRSKYEEQKQKQNAYDRMRKKPYKASYKRRKALLYLLEKGIGQLQELLNTYQNIELPPWQYAHLGLIKKVLVQQKYLYQHPDESYPERIVSLHKPYLRPIVRGKENKRVEFGMKVHMLQVDGICLFDHMAFKAFNESTRLKLSLLKHRSIFGQCHQLSADRIYATNANRRYLTGEKIFTSFPKKGPKSLSKSEKKLKHLLGKQRACDLEGSFGNHKNHYRLGKVKAGNARNEMVWVFFGVMTANAVRISKRGLEKTPPSFNIAA